MLIEKLFERDIFRPINGVVKADQLDNNSVWQELDEFVITRELDRHFRKFIEWYLQALEDGRNVDPTGKMAIWISGFFGSGKSHFLKVLSYLLSNRTYTSDGQSQRAVEFFESKISDATLFADIKRAVVADTDVVLFNIDSKADHGSGTGRDLILRVFLKVLNELQGYSGDHPHIAHMERYLDGKGKLKAFHAAFERLTGTTWENERDAYQFNQDEVVKALSEALGQSEAASIRWIEGAEGNFALSVENFCRWVNEYLDSKGPRHRIAFLVDEVGQFIGTDSASDAQSANDHGRTRDALPSPCVGDRDLPRGHGHRSGRHEQDEEAGFLQDSGTIFSASVAIERQRRRGHSGPSSGEASRREGRTRSRVRCEGRHPQEPAYVQGLRHGFPPVQGRARISSGTTRSLLISSCWSKGYSNPFARPGRRACIWHAANGLCSTPSSLLRRPFPRAKSASWCLFTISIPPSRASSTPRSRRRSIRPRTTPASGPSTSVCSRSCSSSATSRR